VNFEKYFSQISLLYTKTVVRSAWFLDRDASHHMTKVHELFSSLRERDLDVHVEIGDYVKYAVKGEIIVMFQL
jgi:hypothetical protein